MLHTRVGHFSKHGYPLFQTRLHHFSKHGSLDQSGPHDPNMSGPSRAALDSQNTLPEIDVPPNELKRLSEKERKEILKRRQQIIRALVDTVWVYADKRVRIEGLLDGSEAAQFEYETLQINHFAL